MRPSVIETRTKTLINCLCLATDRPQLRLILKVGGASTPDLVDHGDSSSGMSHRHGAANLHYGAEDDSRQSSLFSFHEGNDREKHKKKKEKKKKKNKDKDKEKKKHKHKVGTELIFFLFTLHL